MAEVKEVLDFKNDAQPQHNVNRGRSNQWGINRASWANIMKDIGYTQYRVRRHQELSPLNEERRLEFCKLMKKKPEDFFSNLVITDEKMFVVKGHVYSRKNCVIYSKKGEGSPQNWFSTSSVYPKKLHVWAAVCASGHQFGPYFIEEKLNSARYISLLEEEVLPDMREVLGEDGFKKIYFQQDGNEIPYNSILNF